ncbi:MAG TPA: hypothetical protein PKK25_13875, partial [Deltaproteobacteria bacterium]|nr:hypothetical protein [Deltaproteobacteria bacterium]HOI08708.1 hypothetical protein [Deltaproteobacteria bacterium]
TTINAMKTTKPLTNIPDFKFFICFPLAQIEFFDTRIPQSIALHGNNRDDPSSSQCKEAIIICNYLCTLLPDVNTWKSSRSP